MLLTKKALFASLIGLSGVFSHAALSDDVPAPHAFTANDVFHELGVTLSELTSHPRLLVNAQSFIDLKKRMAVDPALNSLVDEVIRRATVELEKNTIVYKARPGVRPSILDVSRDTVRIIMDSAFAWQITRDERYANKVIETLLAVTRFPDWNAQTHFLDTGEMMFAVGLGYDWVFDKLTPEQEKIIREAMFEKGIKQTVQAFEKNDPADPNYGFPWWATNWNEVCNGGALAAILAVAEHYPAQTKYLLDRIVPSLQMGLNAYRPDGASAEGPIYWSYGMTYRILSYEMLASAFGRHHKLADDDLLKRSGWYRYAIEGPSGQGFNYGDAVEDQGYTPAYAWFGNKFSQDTLIHSARTQMVRALEVSKTGKQWGEFDRFLALYAFWYPKDVNVDSSRLQEKTFVFHGPAEVFTYKQKDDDRDATWLAVKSGDNTANHAHQDLGSFVLEMNGVRWATDLGKDYYSLPGYFDKKFRSSYYRISALSHNTLTFDGKNQSPSGYGKLTWDEKKQEVNVELTQAYPDIAENIHRQYKIAENGNKIVITDSVKKSLGDHEYRWGMVTTADISLSGNTAYLTKEGKKLKITTTSNDPFLVISTTPEDTRQKRNEGTRMLALKSTVKDKGDYQVSFTITK
ncbi:heparinase II/III family protein [Pectobacterium brasiliense]|uniref:heparinase II/III domain-containing protein n=1 Tax=Pectobacterium brasiliense TaxID=180957 RepID=UPI0032EC1C32